MKLSGYLSSWFILVLLCMGICCSQAVKKESLIDTPKDRYLSGIQKLGKNDLNAAESDFLRAIELDKKSPYGHTGMAFLELERTNYKSALKQVKKALKQDKNLPDSHIAKGRIITARKHGETWYEEAVESLERAIKLDTDNQQALFFMGECHLKGQEYEKAQKCYTQALLKKGVYYEKASNRKVLVSKIITAVPLSEKGRHIALDDKIDRSDLCVLLIAELRISELIKKNSPILYEKLYSGDFPGKNHNGGALPDVNDHPSRKWIYDIIPLHLTDLDVFPNSFFYPDKLLTRAQFAMVMQDVVAKVTNTQYLATMFVGSESNFPDVRSDYYAFNAITFCVEKGIMKVNPDTGFFDTGNTVSGVDAILMIHALEHIIGEYTKSK